MVDVLTDTAHLGLGDAAREPQRRHQGIDDLAGGKTTGAGLLDHRVQGLIKPAAGINDQGQKAADVQFADLQREIPHLGGKDAGPITIVVGESLLAALMARATQKGRDL